MSIDGFATKNGTSNYRERMKDTVSLEHFRQSNGLYFSSFGLGTYLGDPNDEADSAYESAVKDVLTSGVNHIDTAINYRFQRSERSIGRALKSLLENESLSREEIIIATKGGFVPFDEKQPEEPLDYIRDTFIEPGIVMPDDFSTQGHCIHPDYLRHQLNSSLSNLNLETLDIYYLHNPEAQLEDLDRETFHQDLRRAFEFLESQVEEGKIKTYGIATWNAFRQNPGEDEYLDLQKIYNCAKEAGGDDHNFSALQLPINLGMSETFTLRNQSIEDEELTTLEAAQELGLTVMASASIMQGRLADDLPVRVQEELSEYDSDVHRSLQFTRSVPGVTCALVGMKTPSHIDENMKLTEIDPLSQSEFDNRFMREI